jgi:hypothetical protein
VTFDYGYSNVLESCITCLIFYVAFVGLMTKKLSQEHHAMKAYGGSGGVVPRNLDLDTR